ncbi:hypothetical protein IFO69_10215 [Echinicola sp. CAU 1574]|uniref:Uncharacterized protein n=1 Tax=Echinicola arenosa TaxID=2774144 RepID=A0ABR9AJX8_9BACT|nr:hypothetical protein [Echinicola arenosa]MBD8489119.1 hypothetical protein [Echinicola arenosa]
MNNKTKTYSSLAFSFFMLVISLIGLGNGIASEETWKIIFASIPVVAFSIFMMINMLNIKEAQ